MLLLAHPDPLYQAGVLTPSGWEPWVLIICGCILPLKVVVSIGNVLRMYPSASVWYWYKRPAPWPGGEINLWCCAYPRASCGIRLCETRRQLKHVFVGLLTCQCSCVLHSLQVFLLSSPLLNDSSSSFWGPASGKPDIIYAHKTSKYSYLT